ncbi:MAG: mitochondrial fission ELM1 family protein [Henriciella sp.]|nr:mitochondrial fission ELM1 family protein [Henriciella sp.]
MTAPQTSLGPSIWAVSDGRAGNAAQVRAIVQALSETRRWMQIAHINGAGHRTDPITLDPRAPWTWLPGIKWPVLHRAIPNAQRTALTSPWPSVWIAAGRRSAPFTAAIRNWSGGKTLAIPILAPKADPSAFDLLVVPEHDRLSGDNVITTIGSPSHFSEDAIEETGQMFADLADERSQSAIVILGGDSKAHKFTKDDATRLESQLEALAQNGWRLRITTSRRTPVAVTASMRAMADRAGAQFWASAADGPNPYLGWLLYSSAAIVTEDSANMLCDAAWHGLPLHIAKISGGAPKFDRLHTSLIDRGCARWFEGSLARWDYTPLREAGRVADLIIERLLERHPQPKMAAIETGKTAAPDWL